MNAPLKIDPLSPEFRRNSIAIYQQLLQTQPITALDGGRYLLCGYHDVKRALTDLEAFRRPIEASIARREPGSMSEAFARNNMIGLNPPDNTRYRRAMARAFAPRRVEQLMPAMQKSCDRLIDQMLEKGECDFIHDFALPLPVAIICQMLNIPLEDEHLFAGWSAAMLVGLELSADPNGLAAADKATADLYKYLEEIVAGRRKSPGDDLISTLIEAADAEKIRPEEVIWGSITLLVAGHETTTHLLGNGMLALIRNPDQLQLLRDTPTLAENAVEEFLRYDPSVYVLFRETSENVAFGTTNIPKGAFLILSLAAANRDPSVFADPDRLDITRDNAKQHLAFGAGFHLCLGQAVARLEGRIAFETLVRRVGTIELSGEPTPRDGLMFTGYHKMPVRLR
ncbi:MAG: cytochrome P450 [Candidatus Sphingomonas colombiensis]|nr:cytochrome P450 [Sphingomonas sp.]WEK43890.1 MAG: cytochrome P450 [Sphingomonas sp.]